MRARKLKVLRYPQSEHRRAILLVVIRLRLIQQVQVIRGTALQQAATHRLVMTRHRMLPLAGVESLAVL